MYQQEERSYIDTFQDDGEHVERIFKRTAPNTNEALKKHVAEAVAKYRHSRDYSRIIGGVEYEGIHLCLAMCPTILPANLKQLSEDCYAPDDFIAHHGKSLLKCISDACEEYQSQFRHWYDFEDTFPRIYKSRGAIKDFLVPMDTFYAETACKPMVGTLDGVKALTNRSFGRMKQLLQKDADATARLAWWDEDRFIAWDFESDRFVDECGYPYSPSNEHRQCTNWVIRTASL